MVIAAHSLFKNLTKEQTTSLGPFPEVLLTALMSQEGKLKNVAVPAQILPQAIFRLLDAFTF